MLSFKPVVLAVVFAGADASVLRRWLSLPKLAGYNPGTQAVTLSLSSGRL
jgi:hypothetical protein